MKKSLIVLSALAFTSLSALAGGPEMAPPPPPPCFDGFYIGAGIGFQALNFNTRNAFLFIDDFNPDDGEASALIAQSNNGAGIDVSGTFFAGYGLTFWDQQAYAGLEGWLTVSDISNRSRNFSSTFIPNSDVEDVSQIDVATDIKQTLNTVAGGLDFRLGWLITPTTLIYGKVGVGWDSVRTRIRTFVAEFDGDGDQFDTTGSDLSRSRTRDITAFRAGGGIEQCINQDWSIRADYTWSDYGTHRFDRSFGEDVIDTGNQPPPIDTDFFRADAFRTNITKNEVYFSLVYRLNTLF